jgi:hypothetical protein
MNALLHVRYFSVADEKINKSVVILFTLYIHTGALDLFKRVTRTVKRSSYHDTLFLHHLCLNDFVFFTNLNFQENPFLTKDILINTYLHLNVLATTAKLR